MARGDQATNALKRRVDLWATRLKVSPRVVRVQRMVRKWGSCSTAGTITLAADLCEQNPSFQDFVIAHELLHLRVPTHGRLFRALLTLHLPNWRTLDVARRRPLADAMTVAGESPTLIRCGQTVRTGPFACTY